MCAQVPSPTRFLPVCHHQGEEKPGCAVSSRSTSTWEGPGPLLLAPVGSRCPKGSAGGMLSCRDPHFHLEELS